MERNSQIVTPRIARKDVSATTVSEQSTSNKTSDATECWKPSTLFYQFQKISGEKRSVIQEIILQRLILSLHLMSTSELQNYLEVYSELKEARPTLCLASFLIEREILDEDTVQNFSKLRHVDGLSLIPNYEIQEAVGEGGMAAVYLARKIDQQKQVAIKIFAPPVSDISTEIARFKQECSVAMKLKSSHVIQCYDSGDFQGLYYLVMEYVEGGTLADQIEKEGQLDQTQALDLFENILQGMCDAWNQNVIHRDIKPGNIMMDNGKIKICDFGLAKALDYDEEITKTGVIMGTPQYMAPEQFSGKVSDYRVDVYSLGVTLYVMLTGRLPFSGNSYVEFSRAHVEDVPLNPSVIGVKISKPLLAFLFKLLSKEAKDRCDHPTHLLENFQRVRANKYPKGGVVYFREKRRKKLIHLTIGMFILSSLLGLGYWAHLKKQESIEQQRLAKVKTEEARLRQEKNKREKQQQLKEQQEFLKEQEILKQKREKQEKILAKKQAAEKLKFLQKQKMLEEERERERQKLLQQKLHGLKTILPELNWQAIDNRLVDLEKNFSQEQQVKIFIRNIQLLRSTHKDFRLGRIVSLQRKLTKLIGFLDAEDIGIILRIWLMSKRKDILKLWLKMNREIQDLLPAVLIEEKWLLHSFMRMSSGQAKALYTILQRDTAEVTKSLCKKLLAHRRTLRAFRSIHSDRYWTKLPRYPLGVYLYAYKYLSKKHKQYLCLHFAKVIRYTTSKTGLGIGSRILKEKNSSLDSLFADSLGKIPHPVSFSLLQKIVFSKVDFTLQKKAAKFLASFERYKSIELILESSDPIVKRAALEKVVTFSNKSVQNLLEKGTNNIDVEIRKISVQNLVNFPNKQGIETLAQSLEDGNAEVRAFAAKSLAKINNIQALKILINSVRESQMHISRKAFANSIASTEKQEALEALVDMCTESRQLYRATEDAIVSFKDRAVPLLLEVLEQANPRDARLVSNLLEKIGQPSAKGLYKLLQEAREFFRQKVLIVALGNIGDPIAIPELIKNLKISGLRRYSRRALLSIYSKLEKSDVRRKQITEILEDY